MAWRCDSRQTDFGRELIIAASSSSCPAEPAIPEARPRSVAPDGRNMAMPDCARYNRYYTASMGWGSKAEEDKKTPRLQVITLEEELKTSCNIPAPPLHMSLAAGSLRVNPESLRPRLLDSTWAWKSRDWRGGPACRGHESSAGSLRFK